MMKHRRFSLLLPLLLSLGLALSGCALEFIPADAPASPDSAAQNELPVLEEGENLESGSAPRAVHFRDVGQADSILVCSGGETMLVDAGDIGGGDAVVDYLKSQGVEKLDYLVMTHPHADHIGGMPEVLEAFPVGTVILPDAEAATKLYTRVLESIFEKELAVQQPIPGDSFSLGEAQCLILGPAALDYEELNNFSVVLKVTLGDTSFLLTGDAEAQAEQDILDTGADVQANVLKVGHHGSYTSSSQAFLDAVHPQMAVISVGEGNSYGMPHKEPLQRLRDAGIRVLRTDQLGPIVICSDGQSLSISHAQDNAGSQPYYIGNRNSQVFHTPGCPSVEKMKEKNQVRFDSREEAESQGYSPCQSCKP